MEIIVTLRKTPHKIINLATKNGKKYIVKQICKPYNIDLYIKLMKNPHPFISKIYSIIEDDDILEVTEEYIDGKPLSELINIFSSDEKKTIFNNIMIAVNHLHSLEPPIIHRDIKPDNFMVSHGVVKLIDFEISRLPNKQNKDTQILGSIGYAAPEQFGFKQTDARADIYALGVLYNVLMTSHLPSEQMYRSNEAFIEKCISFDPNNRYQSVQAMLVDFDSKNKILFYNWNRLLHTIAYIAYFIFAVGISFGVSYTSSPDPYGILSAMQKITMLSAFVGSGIIYYMKRKAHQSKSRAFKYSLIIWFLILLIGAFLTVIFS